MCIHMYSCICVGVICMVHKWMCVKVCVCRGVCICIYVCVVIYVYMCFVHVFICLYMLLYVVGCLWVHMCGPCMCLCRTDDSFGCHTSGSVYLIWDRNLPQDLPVFASPAQGFHVNTNPCSIFFCGFWGLKSSPLVSRQVLCWLSYLPSSHIFLNYKLQFSLCQYHPDCLQGFQCQRHGVLWTKSQWGIPFLSYIIWSKLMQIAWHM